jgi:hypothetical protein
LGEECGEASRALQIVIDVDVDLDVATGYGTQRLIWLLATLLVRSTTSIIEVVGIDLADTPLLDLVDPSAPAGSPSLVENLRATVPAFGPFAVPIVDANQVVKADLVLTLGTAGGARPDAEILYVAADGWTGAVSPNSADVCGLDTAHANPFGAYLAACLAAGEVYKRARFRNYDAQAVAMNAWTLTHASTGLAAVAEVDPGEPVAELDQVLAGVGAIGSAFLLALWNCQQVSGIIRAADADLRGIDDTNLNRCVPFLYSDIGRPKADVAAERLRGHHGLAIKALKGRAEGHVGPETHLVSAVDKEVARQSLQDRYPASAIQASTSGLRLEMLRVDPTTGTACLRCFNPPPDEKSDSAIRQEVADMDDASVAALADDVGVNPQTVRTWGRVGGCGHVGAALLDRLRPSDAGPAQFSVGFMSVLAGTILAAQAIKDAVRRSKVPAGISDGVPLVGDEARFVANLAAAANGLGGVRRYVRDAGCPACRGVRADIWASRWSG